MHQPITTNKLVPIARTAEPLPPEALRPLMHSLLSFGLVTRVETPDGKRQWRLTEAAEARLDQLSISLEGPVAELAYLDHSCAVCRQQCLTHLRDGRYLCPDCQQLEAEGPPPIQNLRVQRRWGRPRQ